jgi:radical SAM protein with 4Fe4S-binding SPASM domain
MLKSNKKTSPTDALVAVTYKCNARCTMCNIWKETPKNELKPADFAKLPKSLKDINITGGEPFLRNDITEIIGEITSAIPNVRLVFSSNGFLTEKIIDDMRKIRKINSNSCIAVSLDGLKEVHDEVRGINNAYEKVINTVTGLKKAGINDIRFGYTAGKYNIDQLKNVYGLSRDLGIEFTLSVVHNSDNYFSIETNQTPELADLEKNLIPVIEQEQKTVNLRKLLRTYYMKGLIHYVKDKKRLLPCFALDDFFFLDPQGNVYPCNMLEKKVGNIQENDFNSIWNSQASATLRNYCKKCNGCWMVCTAKSSIRKNAAKVLFDISKEFSLSKT